MCEKETGKSQILPLLKDIGKFGLQQISYFTMYMYIKCENVQSNMVFAVCISSKKRVCFLLEAADINTSYSFQISIRFHYICNCQFAFGPGHSFSYKIACAPTGDSDQTAHPYSLITSLSA